MALYWRIDRTPTDNKKVRLALNMAIDSQAYIKTILNGKGIMLNRCVLSIDPETMYTPLEKLPPEAKDQFTYNPARAKQLLAEAGYPTGFTFKLIAPSYYPVPETISLIESWWKEIGVKLDAKIIDPAVFTSTMYGKGHDMGVLLYRAIPSAFTELRTYSSLAEIWNPSCYNDPDYQKGFEDMKTTVDPVARAAKIKALNIMVLSAYTGVLFPEGYGWTASQPWVRNYHGECGVGYWWFGPIYSHVWIDTAMKKAATGRE